MRIPKHSRTLLLQAESGCESISDRLENLALRLYTKIKPFSDSHPFFQHGKLMHSNLSFLGSAPKYDFDLPLDMALKKLERLYKTPSIRPCLPEIQTPLSPTFPESVKFQILNLKKPKQSMTPEEKISTKESVMLLIDSLYANHTQFFVDGSKDPESGRAGAGIYGESQECPLSLSHRLSDGISSTQAELAAISILLSHLVENPPPTTNFVIFCDSQPAIMAIKSYKFDPLEAELHHIFEQIKIMKARPQFALTFHWIPSHIGIEGNEKADVLANQGALIPLVTHPAPVTIGQVNSKIRAVSLKIKVQRIKALGHKSAYKRYLDINPTLKPLNFPISHPEVQQWVNRLRVGSDEWCHQHDTPNICEYCDRSFSAAHYLADCPVSSRSDFLETLSVEDFSLPPEKRAIVILQKFHCNKLQVYIRKAITKHPPKIRCPHPEHGKLSSFFLSIPMGL